MARRRVRGAAQWRQPLLPGLAAQLAGLAARRRGGGAWRGGAGGAAAAGGRGRRTRTGKRGASGRRAGTAAGSPRPSSRRWRRALHARRPRGYVVVGWRERTLVTRLGEVRVRRRLYRAPDGDGALPAGRAPGLAAGAGGHARVRRAAGGLGDRRAVPHGGAARGRGHGGGGQREHGLAPAAAGGPAGHGARGGDARDLGARRPPCRAPVGARVVPVLYLEADGVWVKTQREPAHRTGYELKCASMYEGWRVAGGPHAGPPAPALPPAGEAGVLPRPRAGRRAGAGPLLGGGEPGAVPHLRPEPDPAWWSSAATARTGSTPRWRASRQAVRQRDGFHLARDAARGWGPDAGATLYQAVRAGDQATATALLALPAPPRARPGCPRRPTRPRRPPRPAPARAAPPRGTWSATQASAPGRPSSARSRTPDAGSDWRVQVPPALVPPDARGPGHAGGHQRAPAGQAHEAQGHGLARRRRPRHGQGPRTGHQRRALAPWCHRPPPAAAPLAPRARWLRPGRPAPLAPGLLPRRPGPPLRRHRRAPAPHRHRRPDPAPTNLKLSRGRAAAR